MPGWVGQRILLLEAKSSNLINFLNSPKLESLVQMQVQEGLVKLSKEHLCPEGGLPLSGFDSLFYLDLQLIPSTILQILL